MNSYEAVRACAVAILSGRVLQIGEVSAGNGCVIDWRTTKSGDVLQDGADAFDTAQLFVSLVGEEHAFLAATGGLHVQDSDPKVTTFCQTSNGRRRSFTIYGFTVLVEPHHDDEAQATFTAELAALAARGVL